MATPTKFAFLTAFAASTVSRNNGQHFTCLSAPSSSINLDEQIINPKSTIGNTTGTESLIRDLLHQPESLYPVPGPLEDLHTCQRNETRYLAATQTTLAGVYR